MAGAATQEIMSSQTPSPPDILEALIIGAGPSGISALKELLAACPDLRKNDNSNNCESSKRKIVVLEESDAVGGMWHRPGAVYRNDVKQYTLSDSDGGDDGSADTAVATSSNPIYEDLVANLPREFMCFRDMIYPRDVPAMPRPHHVQEYFNTYATVHNLFPYIQFKCSVVQCRKITDSDSNESYWEVTALEERLDGSKAHITYRSKRLLVCAGHHRKAYVPSCIRGIQHYRGKILHSSAFSSPNQFEKGSTVLLVGGGISGADIGRILHRSGLKVLLSVREWKTWPHGALLKKQKKKGLIRPGISHIDKEGTVHFDSTAAGRSVYTNCAPVRPDAIIFSTGYRYDYPFLPRDGSFIQPGGHKMCNLYQRMIYVNDPSLAFFQVPKMLFSGTMLMEYQSIWFAQYFQGKFDVTKEMMETEIRTRKDDKTQDSLGIFVRFVPYCNSLARMAGDVTFWKQMLWIRFPMIVRSVLYSLKQKVSSRLSA